MRDTNCFTAIITARDGVDRADGSAPLPAVSKAPSPIMPHNDLSYHLRRAEQETRMAIGALVPRAEANKLGWFPRDDPRYQAETNGEGAKAEKGETLRDDLVVGEDVHVVHGSPLAREVLLDRLLLGTQHRQVARRVDAAARHHVRVGLREPFADPAEGGEGAGARASVDPVTGEARGSGAGAARCDVPPDRPPATVPAASARPRPGSSG